LDEIRQWAAFAYLCAMALALDDVEADFRRAFEPLKELTPRGAWRALLTQAQRPVARTRTMHSADDYVAFDVHAPRDGRTTVTLERRIARISEPYEYEGTLVFACYMTLAADPLIQAHLTAASFEGHVSAYAEVDGADDRPPLDVFRQQVEASAEFRAFCESEVLGVLLSSGQA
jgi:hypothetical protein